VAVPRRKAAAHEFDPRGQLRWAGQTLIEHRDESITDADHLESRERKLFIGHE
jgi:hypothetical protein